MPKVHKIKSGAKGFCEGRPKGRGRSAKTSRSRFVLVALVAAGAYVAGTAWEFTVKIVDLSDLTTVICPEPSVSRASEAAAKRKDPADASVTFCWRQFQRA